MMNEQQNHPLHGLGLKKLLTVLVDHYGWEILAEQINVNCFKVNPSIKSSHKFLHQTTWARERLEAFYLYKYKQFPLPDDDQHTHSPRNRVVELKPLSESPAQIELGDPEFFDDPISGPVFPSKKTVNKTRSRSKNVSIKEPLGPSGNSDSKPTNDRESNKSVPVDPWHKWRE